MAYTSVTLVQQKTGTTLTADQQSYLNTVIIPAVDAWLNHYLGISSGFGNAGPVDTTVLRSGDGSASLQIGFVQVQAVALVDPAGNVDTYDATDWVQQGGVLFKRNGVWPRGLNNLRVTVTTATIPAITLAATVLASNMFDANSSSAIQSEKIGDYQVTYSTGSTGSYATPDVYDLLAPYKPIRLGAV